MKTYAAAALLGLLLPAVPLAGTSASAADQPVSQVVLRDGPGDVWVTPVGGDVASPAPDRRTGDLLRARVAHRTHAVVVRLRFADLSGPGRQRHEVEIRTPTGRWSANVTASARNPAGRHRLWQGSGDRVACAGMTHDIDRATGVVRLRIPRSCLGRPQWVRIVETTFWQDSGSVFYTDDPLDHEAMPSRFTPRLYRAG